MVPLRLAPIGMAVPASDGLILRGELSYPPGPLPESGFPLAILAHQYPSTRASYAPLVADLLDRGLATLAFDLRGHGESIVGPNGTVVIDTPRDFSAEAFGQAFMGSIERVGFARIADDIVRVAAWGAAQNLIDGGRLLLVGASVGGTGALLAAPSLPGLAGLITFGAAGAPAHGSDADSRIRTGLLEKWYPTFLSSSDEDPFDGHASIRAWAEGVEGVERVIVPGSRHAMAIYPAVRERLLSWLDDRWALA